MLLIKNQTSEKLPRLWCFSGVVFFLALCCTGCGIFDKDKKTDSLSALPVQYGGRVQPFGVFAQESLYFIYGKKYFYGQPARDIVLSWILIPEFWGKQSFVVIPEAGLKQKLNLNLKQNLFSPDQLLNHPSLVQELQKLKTKTQNKVSLNSYFKSLNRLQNRLTLFQAVARGHLPGLLPPLASSGQKQKSSDKSSVSEKNLALPTPSSLVHNNLWWSLTGLAQHVALSKKPDPYLQQARKALSRIIFAYIRVLEKQSLNQKEGALKPPPLTGRSSVKPHPLLQDKNQTEVKNTPLVSSEKNLSQAVENFQNFVKGKNSEYKKHLVKVKVEAHYQNLNPFRKAWVLYLLGLLVVLLFFVPVIKRWSTQNRWVKSIYVWSSVLSLSGAFLLHGYGMLLRSWVMGRPPVTNMYETLIWVPWVSVIMGALLWRFQKFFAAIICACLLALFCLLLADSTPSHLLDKSLQPLEAVLRSNFWLSTHVLVITMSYAAFFLAFVLGDVLLFFFMTSRGRASVPFYIRSIDRCIQVGVVLLAAGTVLGGVWADYSWGRFWGWDPKETWALITLLGYIALLHGRLAGWLKEFGLAVGSVLVFFLVLMAWYGVNYVLGQGLHSYGFGAGGVEYVSAFVVAHLIYVGLAWLLHTKKL